MAVALPVVRWGDREPIQPEAGATASLLLLEMPKTPRGLGGSHLCRDMIQDQRLVPKVPATNAAQILEELQVLSVGSLWARSWKFAVLHPGL